MNKYFTALALLVTLVACGKKAKNTESGYIDRDERAEIPAPSRFILNQTASCEDPFNCPEALAKLVVLDKGGINYCTGTLVSPTKMVTAASCLPRSLQVSGLDCTTSIFAIFPKTLFFPEELARCRVILSSDSHDDVDPALWRRDLAVIELVESNLRTPLRVSPEGMREDIKLKAFQVDYIDEARAKLTGRDCQPIFNSYANPFSTSYDSPMVAMGDCLLDEGNKGAPLLNARGELVGILGANIDRNISNYLSSSNVLGPEGMSGISHATNFACAPNFLNPGVRSSGCDVNITMPLLNSKRYRLINDKSIHRARMQEVEKQLEASKKYFHYDFYFLYDRVKDLSEINMRKPFCLNEISSWIGEFARWGGRTRTYGVHNFEIPRYRFKTKLDKFLRIYSEETTAPPKKFKVEFNPRDVERFESTYVTISSSADNGAFIESDTYESVTAICP